MNVKISLSFLAVLTLLLTSCSQITIPPALAAHEGEISIESKKDEKTDLLRKTEPSQFGEPRTRKFYKGDPIKRPQFEGVLDTDAVDLADEKNSKAVSSVGKEAKKEDDKSTPVVSDETSNASPETCPVTKAPEVPFIPPEPYPANYPYGDFWYGTENLWVGLRSEGVWSHLPHSEKGYVQKTIWFRDGYYWRDEPQPDLKVTGRLLDSDEPVLIAPHGATNGFHPDIQSFMLAGVIIPTAGCWEITGRYGEHELSYIVWVSP
jgi:hypothetical protein